MPVIFVTLILTAMAVAFAVSARREVHAGANFAAQTQRFYAARGAVIYAMTALANTSNNGTTYGIVPPDATTDANGWMQIGDAMVKIDVLDTASGFDLNSAQVEDLQRLPYLQTNTDLVAAIMDWKTAGTQPSPNGAKSEYYQTLTPPYQCKSAPFDTVDELLLVKGMSPAILYDSLSTLMGGSSSTPTTHSDTSGGDSDWSDVFNNSQYTLADLLTTQAQENNVAADGTARVDINSATAQDLQQKVGLTAAQAQAVIQARDAAGQSGGTGGIPGGNGSGGNGAGGTGSNTGGASGGGNSSGGSGGTPGGKAVRLHDSRQIGGTVGGGTRPGGSTGSGTGAGSGTRPGGTTGSGTGTGSGGTLPGGSGSGGTGTGSGGTGTGGTGSGQGFQSIAALLTVPGMNATTLQQIADKITIDSGTTRNGVVNVNTAPAEVLATVPGMTHAVVSAIMNYRANGQAFQTIGDLFMLPDITPQQWEQVIEHLTTKSSFYTLHIRVRTPGQQGLYAVSALVQLSQTGPKLLQWREVPRSPGWSTWITPPILPAPVVPTTSGTSSSSASSGKG